MTWWEPRTLGHGQELEARIGLLRLRIARDVGRVRVAWLHVEGDEPETSEVCEPRPAGEVEPGWSVHRFAVDGKGDRVALRPALAPMPVVARPEVPFTVVPGGSVVVYLGPPLWAVVEAGGVPLTEIATVPSKGTWFGSPTDGELCVGMRTRLRMKLEDLVPRDHRAVAPVTIRNRGQDPLHVERLWLPAPNLSLHLDEAGRVKTQPVELIRSEGQDEAERKIGKPGAGTPLAPPRHVSDDNPVLRVFNSVFR